MYEHKLQAHGEIFAKGQAVTGTATIGNMNARVEAGNHLGALSVTFTANGPVSVAAGGSLTATVEHADDMEGPYSRAIVLSSSGFEGFEDGFEAAGGQTLAMFPLPDTRRFIQVKISGTGVTGNVDCFLEYLAR